MSTPTQVIDGYTRLPSNGRIFVEVTREGQESSVVPRPYTIHANGYHVYRGFEPEKWCSIHGVEAVYV